MSATATKEGPKVQSTYKGLFTPNVAPTRRAYCILFSFFFGVLEITTGAVFYHVISLHPKSGGEPLHTPPFSLAVGLMAVGIFTLLATAGIAVLYGFDDGDETLEEDGRGFAKEDFLDRQFQATQESPGV